MKTLAFLIIAFCLNTGEKGLTGNRINNFNEGTRTSSEMTGDGEYTLVSSKSILNWTGKKVGGEHHGTVTISGGALKIENGMMVSGKFTVDMNSIVDKDLENVEMNAMLVNHLKSADFFEVAVYPTATFTLKQGVLKSGSGQEAGRYEITGSLTIKGITHDITFISDLKKGKTISIVSDEIVLDRTRWNVNYQSKTVFAQLKDQYIHDEMYVTVEMELQ